MHADQFPGVKGDAAKLHTHLTILGCQDGIFRPGICMELIFRLIMAVCKSDTAWVEKEIVTQPPDLLGVGMPACQHLTRIGSKNLLKFFLGYGWQDNLIKGSGGAVKAQQVEPLFQPDRDPWLKFGDKVHIIFAEL